MAKFRIVEISPNDDNPGHLVGECFESDTVDSWEREQLDTLQTTSGFHGYVFVSSAYGNKRIGTYAKIEWLPEEPQQPKSNDGMTIEEAFTVSKCWTLTAAQDQNGFGRAVVAQADKLVTTLLSKNAKYGNSALEPLRVFSKSTDEEGILVRIDDKLNRIKKGIGDDEDTIGDLIGYLVLLQISRQDKDAK